MTAAEDEAQPAGAPTAGLCGRDALDRCLRLKDLAPYVLQAEVLKLARAWARHVGVEDELERNLTTGEHRAPGWAVALFVWKGTSSGWEQLMYAPAFGLPLIWDAQAEDDENLPAPLRTMAEQIRHLLGTHTRPGEKGKLALRLGVDPQAWRNFWDALGLRSDDLEVASAFAPLAAAFVLAQRGGRVRPEVYATGAHDTFKVGGIGLVGELPDKIAFLKRVGGKTLFVPIANVQVAQMANARDGDPLLTITGFEEVNCAPSISESERVLQALRPLLGALSVPPGVGAALSDHGEYMENMAGWATPEEVRQYYRHNVLELEVKEIRKRFQHPLPIQRLVALLEPTKHDVFEILWKVLALKSHDCLAFLSGDGPPPPCLRGIKYIPVPPETARDFESLRSFLREHAAPWLEPNQSLVAWDITAGTKLMTLAMARVAAELGGQLCFLESPTYLKHAHLPWGEKTIKLFPSR